MKHIYIVTNTSIKPLEKGLVLNTAAAYGISNEFIQFINYVDWTKLQNPDAISILAMNVEIGGTTLKMNKWAKNDVHGNIFTCGPLGNILDSPIKFFDLKNIIQKIADFDIYKTYASSVQKSDIIVAKTSEDFVKIIEAGRDSEYLDCDIETRGFDFIRDPITCLGICYAEAKSVVITATNALANLEPLQKLFDNKTLKFCWTNGKFDIKFLRYQWNCPARVDEDIYLSSYALDERKGVHGLEYQAENVLNIDAYKNQIKFETVSENDPDLIQYLGKDVYYQRGVRTHREKELVKSPESNKLYRNILLPASEALARVEMNGIPVNIPYTQFLDKKYGEDLEERRDLIIQYAAQAGFEGVLYANATGSKSIPKTFNPASPKQLAYLLIDLLQLPPYKKTRTTAEEALTYWLVSILKFPIRTIDEFESVEDSAADSWLAEGSFIEKAQKRIIYNLIYFRRFSKLHSTYITTVLEKHTENHRVHATFKIGGTVTGRLSSEGPNLQNIPRRKEIKDMFAPSEGKTLIEVDYSQAELRVLAYLSQDPVLIDTYMQDKDLHDAVAMQIWGPNFTKEQRVGAKTINFGLAYGRGASSVAEQLNISKKDAQGLMDQWFAAMPVAGAWIKNARQSPYKSDPVTPFGRTRRFGLTTRMNANSHENEAVNFPIQSVASDLTLQSAIEVQKALDEMFDGIRPAKIVNIVHDAILVECLDNYVREVAALIKNTMEALPAKLLNTTIPFKADVEVSKIGWGSKSKYKEVK